jgi:hypothetical protein
MSGETITIPCRTGGIMRLRNTLLISLLIATSVLVLVHCRGRGTDTDGILEFSGLVTDAASGNPVAEALVTVNGPVRSTVSTDSAGLYSVAELSSGTYQVTASKGGYIPLTKGLELADDPDARPELNFVLSEGLAAGEWRFVLTWGEQPYDVDAHMWSGPDHIYWNDPGSDITEPFIFLDVDDRESYGPETITIKVLDSLCQYAVHNFSGTPALTSSDAHVDIYSEGALVAGYDVPTSGTGDWWYVGDLDTNGTITLQNTIGSAPPVTAPPSLVKKPVD